MSLFTMMYLYIIIIAVYSVLYESLYHDVSVPKIHKTEVPLRPIVCTIGSATYNLTKELNRILSPLVGKTDSYVKNSSHFVSSISHLNLEKNDLLVSFDVKSLFTRVPINDALTIIKDRLILDEDLGNRTTMTPLQICHLVELCLRSTFFRFGDKLYEQTDGTAMGSPLSPTVANIFMEDFEMTAISTSHLQPKLWRRYVDDTFVIWPHNSSSLQDFLSHINSLHDRIEFTMEMEVNNSIAFLDVLISKNNNRLTTTVYRKPTHTDRYLNYRSNHHPLLKSGIINCLKERAINVCSEDTLPHEINRLHGVFRANGFPSRRIYYGLNQSKPKKSTTVAPTSSEESLTTEKKKRTLVLPYVKGLSEGISQACRSLNIKTAFTSRNTLRRSLSHVKIPTPPEDKVGVIYEIPCECGAVYIGETGRTMKIRKAKHKRAVKNGDTTNALALHFIKTGHKILWDECRILATQNITGPIPVIAVLKETCCPSLFRTGNHSSWP